MRIQEMHDMWARAQRMSIVIGRRSSACHLLPLLLTSALLASDHAHAPVSASRPAATQPAGPVTRLPDAPGLHNVFQLWPNLLSGSVPDHAEGFASLRQLGVRTIISVDAATPDVAAAKASGMRYVHIPVGYHGLSADQQLALAKALHDLPKPVYIHCHHGKHRGPAAAASAAVLTGQLSNTEAILFLEQAGTSSSYPGLYRCVMKAFPLQESALRDAQVELPEIARVAGFAQAMSLAQDAYDHLTEIRDAGWRTPASHPDLAPAAEAGRLENLLRGLREAPETRSHPPEFATMMDECWRATNDLESALKRGSASSELTQALKRIDNACRACHVNFRDRK